MHDEECNSPFPSSYESYESDHTLPTCLLSVMALGWHLVQMPAGQGGWSTQPGRILQLRSSMSANFPLWQHGVEAYNKCTTQPCTDATSASHWCQLYWL